MALIIGVLVGTCIGAGAMALVLENIGKGKEEILYEMYLEEREKRVLAENR